MKKELQYIIIAHVLLICFLLYESLDLISLLNDRIPQEYFTQEQMYNSSLVDQEQLIPKIIHQTYKTTEIPEIWKLGQQLCIDLHPDYEYILWTDDMSRSFIAEKYPWFLDTFDNYQYPIQRADLIRYFVLNHYGGIYLDLDDGCSQRLDPLLSVPAFVRKTLPTGISNDVMGSIPKHPFFTKVINDISKYDRNWFVPYITIMISTGPLFLSVMWKQYKRWGVEPDLLIKVIPMKDYKTFFNISKGSSWHTNELNYFLTLLRHLPLAVLAGVLTFFAILALEFLIYKMVCLVRFNNLFNMIKYRSWSDYKALGDELDEFEDQIIHLQKNRVDYIKRHRKDSNLPVKIDWEKQSQINTEMV